MDEGGISEHGGRDVNICFRRQVSTCWRSVEVSDQDVFSDKFKLVGGGSATIPHVIIIIITFVTHLAVVNSEKKSGDMLKIDTLYLFQFKMDLMIKYVGNMRHLKNK